MLIRFANNFMSPAPMSALASHMTLVDSAGQMCRGRAVARLRLLEARLRWTSAAMSPGVASAAARRRRPRPSSLTRRCRMFRAASALARRREGQPQVCAGFGSYVLARLRQRAAVGGASYVRVVGGA